MPSKHLCPRCHNGYLIRDGHTPGGKQRWRCKRVAGDKRVTCYSTTSPAAHAVINQRGDRSPVGKPLKFSRDLKDTKVFIITAAQNGTPVHKLFFASLLQMKKLRRAELIVVPLRYKNPTSRWTESQENAEHWHYDVMPYLYNARKALNKSVVLLADIKTQPTASSPLTGFEAISHSESCIIGHTKLQMKVVPTPSNKLPKILITTGACTQPNYTDSKAGKLGAFHHTLGAVIVEVKNEKIFHLRHVNANKTTGEFTDLDITYKPTGWKIAPPPLALIMGDTHVDFIDPKVEKATFGKGGIIDTLRPRTLVWHDLLDAYSCNPHHRGNPFNAIAKRNTGRDDVAAEVKRAIAFVGRRTPADTESVIVQSNHDNFLARWIMNTDWRIDPTNAEFYLRTALVMVRGTTLDGSGTNYPNPLGYWFAASKLPRVRVLKSDESFSLGGVELGMHGDHGPNGARGSIRNLRRIGVRSVTGHPHAPGIDEGCVQVGTSTWLRLEYNIGPSSWLNTHCALHADGKRQLINIIDGEWQL